MERVGRTTAITVITPVPGWWRAWLWLSWTYAAVRRRLRRPPRRRKRGQLLFIHFARWSVFSRVPSGVGRSGRRLPHAYLLFQSNFNGGAKEYVEAFSLVAKWRMRMLWGGAYGVPDPIPVTPFERYILDNAVPTAHYYGAYPEASTKMILGCLELERRLQAFSTRTAQLEPAAFRAEYDRFLVDVQRYL